MNTLKTLLFVGAIATVLAVVGMTAAVAVLSPTAAEVAQRGVNASNRTVDPRQPPAFYGAR